MGWEVGKKLRRRRVLERIGDSEEEKKALGHRINSNMDVLKLMQTIIKLNNTIRLIVTWMY